MAFGPLIDAEALAGLIGREQVLVCDCRFDLADLAAGRRAYAGGHIPGAVYVDLEQDLSGRTTGANGRHPLPEPGAFAARMAELGVDARAAVIAYDSSNGAYAARLWWMLRWIGHRHVAVLDGGLAAWTASGRRLEAGVGTAKPGTLTNEAPGMPQVEVGQVAANLGTGDLLVLDARSAERFAGVPHPLDSKFGHIPGARSRFYGDNLLPDGRFKAPEELAREFDDLLAGTPPEQVVHQCGSGVTAALNLLAMEAAGLHGSRLYPGSWSEWTSDPVRPVATGPA